MDLSHGERESAVGPTKYRVPILTMCLLIDRRETGITEALTKLRDVDHSVTHLDSADCRFFGNGERSVGNPAGEVVIGCERKRLADLINSMKDRRLSGHQLRLMTQEHDHVYLFIEGMWRPGACGEIEEWRSGIGGGKWKPVYGQGDRYAVNYRQVMNYITTLENLGGVVVRRTASVTETAHQYCALWHWFNDKRWDQHKSHDQVHANSVQVSGRRARLSGLSTRRPPSVPWLMAAQLDGVDEKARAVAGYFRSVRSMANGTVRDWESVPGIGKELAGRSFRAMREECEEDGTKQAG